MWVLVVDSLMNGLGEAIILALTFWMKVPNEVASDSGSLFTKLGVSTRREAVSAGRRQGLI